MRRIASISIAAVLLLSGCEYLFFSPAFMPAVSETELRLDLGTFTEDYNGREVAYGTYSFVDPNLTYNSPNGTSTMVPALDALSIDGDNWHGISEFLGIFFQSTPNITGGGLQSGLTGSFRSYSISFDLDSVPVLTYSLPYAAKMGIADDEPNRTELTGNLSRVDVFVTSAGHENLRGEGTFIFANGPNPLTGLLYMVFYHDSGLVTVAYQRTVDSPSGLFFPDGTFTYVINVFED